jgi:ABC-2 type transport system ATP-binding protein
VAGRDVVHHAGDVRRSIGVALQDAAIDPYMTGRELLHLQAVLHGYDRRTGRRRAVELLERVDLVKAADRRVGTYSGGMRRRLDIAASLVSIPDVLFLDEPTTGLDPRSRSQVWELVRRIAGEGTTVLLTTQYLDEADRLAERLAVVDHGRVIAEGTSRELKASVGANTVHVRLASADQRARALQLVQGVLGDGVLPLTEPLELAARLEHAGQAATILAALTEAKVDVAQFAVGHPSLDEVFLALTGRPADDAVVEAKS